MIAWWEYLDDKKRELTLDEFCALMLFHLREYARMLVEDTKQNRDALEHVEGILGRADAFMALQAARGVYPSDQGQLERLRQLGREYGLFTTSEPRPDGALTDGTRSGVARED